MSNLLFPLADVGAFIDSRTPDYPVDDKTALSGHRASITWATQPRITYAIKQSCLRSLQRVGGPEYQRWLAFFERHFGALDSFLLFDKENSAAGDPSVQGGGMCFGVGDGTTTAFQLQKRTLGSADDAIGGGPWRVSSGPRTNFLAQSQSFLAGSWGYGTGTTGTLNACIAPDNTGATCIAYDGTGSAGSGRIGQTATATGTTPQTVSLWLRADVPTSVTLGTNSGVRALTVALTTTWTRFAFLVTPTAGQDVGLQIYSPAGVNTAFRIYAWGAQSELDVAATGTPTALIQTTSAAVTVNPSFWPAYSDGFLPVTDLALDGSLKIFRNDYQGNVQLYPWARTNLALQSQTFGNGSWSKIATTIGGAVTAPDGTLTALPVTSTGSTGAVQQTLTTLNAGQAYTFSVWLRCAAGGTIRLASTFANGPVFTLTSTWQRFSVPITGAAGSFIVGIGGASSWTTGQIVECWGAQLEAGLSTTSYIPTTTATASVTDYTLPGTGSVSLAVAPRASAILSWLGNYFIRVKCVDTKMSLQRVVLALWSADGLQLIQVLA